MSLAHTAILGLQRGLQAALSLQSAPTVSTIGQLRNLMLTLDGQSNPRAATVVGTPLVSRPSANANLNLTTPLPNKALVFPVTALRLTAFAIAADGQRANTALSPVGRRALKNMVRPSQDSTYVTIRDSIPISLTFDFIYITNSYSSLLAFMQAWARTSQRYSANFNLCVDGVNYPVHVELDPQLSVPEKDDIVTISRPEFFEMSSTLTMSCWTDHQEVTLPTIVQTYTNIDPNL